ncbi:helix-turn-helix domain-containing protein [Amycolatopsis sp., V23-08]|uniref:Helix-turn-helix domain-containing protein n=1 Tax=Amycolatopsis heterodermiae TaxID=3110235 RepID=A0ABU5R7T9_9PSEU|nr:helix-turn-helix domain-containing protein [Amycolatopsis sp., V23-08]MEA5362293.1 helix-turn-helix domain-containing protein [Amycolatopsis sp., V23-08]
MNSTCATSVGTAEGEARQRTLVSLFTNKWSALAIGELEDGPLRFGALQRRLRGVSPKVLTHTLRRLEEFGLVNRVVYPDIPLRVEYSLTEIGRGASGLLRDLRNWVDENMDEMLRASDR